MKKVELLAPAGDLEKLKIAILYGANAVFCGGKQFSLRAKANNFSLDDLKEAVIFANKHHAKIHVTVNIVPEDFDFKTLDEYLLSLNEIGVHAIIVSSVFIMKRAKELNCQFEVHVSTQQSISNSLAAQFFKDYLDVQRVVLARELNIEEIKNFKKSSKLAIETFIHGGMCSSISGRCTLSNYMSNRDANKGGCAHSCRWNYHLYQNNTLLCENTFIMASCDLMSVQYINKLLEANIDSFKIEGRMKSVHYIATVVSAYRRMIDEYYKYHTLSKKRILYYINEIKKAENRITYTGFFNKKMKNEALLLHSGVEVPTQSFIAQVINGKKEKGYYLVEVRNYFEINQMIECFMPNGQSKVFFLKNLKDENGNAIAVARHPKQLVYIKCPVSLQKDTLIRKVEVSVEQNKDLK